MCQCVCCFVIVSVREFVCMDVSVRVCVSDFVDVSTVCVSVCMCL